MKLDIEPFYCPTHGSLLSRVGETELRCDQGCAYPVINGIPRFVEAAQNYAASFGLQWNTFRKTQLDSFTGIPISTERLKRLLGGSLDIVHGKEVLEAGCGAGRFSEVLLQAGAKLTAVDLSNAVDANLANNGQFENLLLAQANITSLPFGPKLFDIVICVGVVQHTPSPEKTIAALCSYVKPGGMLVIDHYSHGYPANLSRKALRWALLKMPSDLSLKTVQMVSKTLWPMHDFLWRNKSKKGMTRLRNKVLKMSPLVDYHDAYPSLTPEAQEIWSQLDTHDTLTDYYKHLRSAEEIEDILSKNGMTDIQTRYAGNGVEARAVKASA